MLASVSAGGFTAAFLDEAFGLLFYSLRQHKLLPFISPAFTARLEVSFKKVLQFLSPSVSTGMPKSP